MTSKADRKLYLGNLPPNITSQQLMDMLNAIVAMLDKLDELTDEIAAMAERHIGYGVKNNHYKHVGDALLHTIEKGLGNDWNPAVKAAWT